MKKVTRNTCGSKKAWRRYTKEHKVAKAIGKALRALSGGKED